MLGSGCKRNTSDAPAGKLTNEHVWRLIELNSKFAGVVPTVASK